MTTTVPMASLLLLGAVHPKVVQEMLGHSTITLTLDTYSHLVPSFQAQVANQMDRLFGLQAEVGLKSDWISPRSASDKSGRSRSST